MKLQSDHKGVGAVEILLILVVVGILGFTGWFVWHSQRDDVESAVNTYAECVKAKGSKIQETYPEVCVTSSGERFTNPDQKVADTSGKSYLTVAEWGVRFTVPAGLSEVEYLLFDEHDGDAHIAIYAKPSGTMVQYRADYKSIGQLLPIYAVGIVDRSSDSKKDENGRAIMGKKIGDKYYYTAWAFSGRATGAACVGLYGTSSEADCKFEASVFELVNQGDAALLNTIETL